MDNQDMTMAFIASPHTDMGYASLA